MVIPKYDINQVVIIYDHGKLIEKVVDKIQIIITEETTTVGYVFREQNDIIRSLWRDFFKDETEVFKSKEDFIKRTT